MKIIPGKAPRLTPEQWAQDWFTQPMKLRTKNQLVNYFREATQYELQRSRDAFHDLEKPNLTKHEAARIVRTIMESK